MNDADVVNHLKTLEVTELFDLLKRVHQAHALDASDPRPALIATRDLLETWAGENRERQLYAVEVEDICRRVGADLSVPDS